MAKQHGPTSSLTEVHRCLSFALRRAMRNVTRSYDVYFRSTDLRGTQFTLLAMLDFTGPITMTALAERLAMERTTLTRNLAVLTERKWIRIEAGRDRRSRRVSITVKGRKAALKALPAWREAHAAMSARLGARMVEEMVDRLGRLAATEQR